MAFTMTLECPECGNVVNSKNWQDCAGVGKKHQAVGMYQVLSLGKYINPLGQKTVEDETIEK